MHRSQSISRRKFITSTSLLVAGAAWKLYGSGITGPDSEPIIDIHQHTDYTGRTNEELVAHQRALGITTTILLPAGRPVEKASTHFGDSNGLAAGAGGNDSCYQLAQKYPGEFLFGANEVPDLEDTIPEIKKYLERGAKVIGESKFAVPCDSPEMQKIYELAGRYDVPVLMHWKHGSYNYGLDRFHTMLEKYPEVNFIGHAQTWWANIDKDHEDQSVMYPKTDVTAGGLTDQLLSDYPNMYGDLGAGSGLNSLTRDEEHARGFLERHQDKLLYGSDCNDSNGGGPDCVGGKTIAMIRKLSPTKAIERKILYKNAKKLFRI